MSGGYRCCTGMILLAATGLAPAAWGGAMRVTAEIVEVVPITEQRQVRRPAAACGTPRPQQHDLVALLAWDLRAACRDLPATEPVVAGYRVYYRWDGRTYSRIMAERPAGATLALRVRLQ